MKDGIHPDNYRMVVFKDMSNEYAFLSKSAAETKKPSSGKTATSTLW